MKRLLLLCALALAAAAGDDEPKVWVHAPAEDLLALFPGKGEGFMISIAEYRKLLALAKEREAALREEPPLPGRLVRGEARARVDGDLLRVEAHYTAVVQGSQPAEVPFPLSGIALESIDAELVGGALRFAVPGTYEVNAVLSARLYRSGGLLRTAFRLPPAAAHTLTVELPPDVEGEVGPIVRAFTGGGTVVGYPDERGLFQLWFKPRSPARQLDALLGATFQTAAEVGEARTLLRTGLQLDILRAPVEKVELQLAPGQTVRSLDGKWVKSWRLVRNQGGGDDTLEVAFVQPLQEAVQLALETELPRDDARKASLPIVRVPAAARYRGTVAVAAQPEVRLKSLTVEGARRLDQAPQGGVALFEVWTPEARLDAEVERVAAETRALTRALLLLREEGKTLQLAFLYQIAGQPLFRLEPTLPKGWILKDVRLDGGVVPYAYEDGRLVLTFPEGLKPGPHGLHVAMETDEVDWVPNEGVVPFELAEVRAGLPEESGWLVVAADPAFRVTAGTTNGLTVVGMDEVARVFGEAWERMLFAWRFERPGYAARFTLERNRPQIDATVINRVAPSERTLATHATVLFDIRRTGVRELTVALPKGTGQLVDFRGPLIKEKRFAEEENAEVWTLVLQKRVRGPYRLDLLFDRKFDADAWSAPAPEITVRGAQEQGFLVIHSGGATAIDIARDGLREADVGELPEAPERPPLEVLAYARHPYHVEISSRRHDPEPVVQAIALSADIYGVLSEDGRLRCRAQYRIRNNDQPFLRFRLPEEATLLGVLVDGEPSKPLREEGMLKLPLPRSQGRETPFLVAIVYDSHVEALEGGGDLTVDRPTLDVDVLKTRYTLHLPGGYELTASDGDLVPLAERRRKTVLGDLVAAFDRVPVFTGGAAGKPTGGPRMSAEMPDRDVYPDDAPSSGPAGAEESKSLDSLKEEFVDEADLEDADEVASDRKAPEARPQAGGKKLKARERTRHGEVPPSLRDPGDPEPPAAPPAEDAGDDFTPPAAEKAAGRGFVAKGGGGPAQPTPAPGGGQAGARRARPERALLSLDLQFLRPDNLVQLDSLAPTGRVRLTLAPRSTFARAHYLGAVLGVAASLALVLTRRRRLLRLLPAAALAIVALHFAGLSFLPPDFARGAGAAIALLLLVLVGWRILAAFGRRVRHARLPWRRQGTVAGALLVLVTAARAGDEVLVPYRDDPEAVERVFLPAEEYHRLRKLAYPEAASRETAFSDARYETVLLGEDLTVRARYSIVKESPDPERIVLALGDVAVTSAVLDGKPADLTVGKDGYVLVVQGQGSYVLELELKPRLVVKGGTRSFRFPVRPVANATMTVKHDRESDDLDVVAVGARENALWRIGPVAVAGATWTPRTEEFKAREAELRADTETMVSVRDGFTAVAARLRYSISGGQVDRLRIAVGNDLTVRAVACENLAGWEIDSAGNVVLALTKPADKALVVEVFAERPAARERTETLPAIAPLDVVRDAGVVALETLPELKLDVLESQGLLRGQREQAPAKLSAVPDAGEVVGVFRYAVRPFTLRWRVYLEETRVRADATVDVYLDRDRSFADVALRLAVERGAGPFTSQMTVPAGYEVEAVQGPLRDWWVEEGRLYLDRPVRQTAPQDFRIVLRRRGATAEPFPAPTVSLVGAAREAGLVRVAVGDGLELETGESGNLLPEDVAKAGRVKWGHLVRAYRYYATPWRLEVSTKEEPREVDALVVSRVVPLADRVQVEALVDFHVRRGLVDTFRFFVPVAEEGEALIHADDRREITSEPVEGGRLFTVTLRTPTRGSASVTVGYLVAPGAVVRGVEPRGVAATRRYVAVEKVPDGEVRVTGTTNLDPGEFEDLPLRAPETTQQNVARIFVGASGPFALELAVRRHSFEEVAKAVVYRAGAIAVVDRSGWVRVLVSYRVYNRSEQFLRLRLPGGAQLYSVLVAGEGVRPLGEGGDLLVPLRKLALGSPTFDVDVTYAYTGERVGAADFDVRLPEVKGLDVRRTTLSLYLPKEFDYAFDTEMEEVAESDIAAGEATDLYEEIKELYDVAQRGNRLQAGRALSNVQQLEQEAERVMDQLRSTTRDQSKLQQVESQEMALQVLRDANEQLQAQQPQDQTVQTVPGLRGASVWSGNTFYLDKSRGDETRKQVDEFLARQSQSREPQAGGYATYSLEGALLADQRGAIGIGGGAGGETTTSSAPVFFSSKDEEARRRVTQWFGFSYDHEATIVDGLRSPESGFYFNDGADGTYRGRVENLFDAGGGGGGQGGGIALKTAAGRISLRIELPREGEVHHFARLGAQGEVTFDATERGGTFWQALLALACAGGAFWLLRFRD